MSRRSSESPSALPWLITFLFFVLLVISAVLTAYKYLKPSATSPVESREITPKSDFDFDEREAVTLFKTSKESVVNVDTVVLRRNFSSRSTELLQAGTGSGFIWDDDGHIVTNFHVIQEALRNRLTLRVVLSDRSEWNVTVVGVAAEYDLAVLKISKDAPLKKIKVGTSKDLEVGQKCYAIGNPFGLSLSLTKGIISALDREIDSPAGSPISGAIQTDAPINPGNSGGPLLDKDGRLIGVNTAIATAKDGGGNVGIGFAIPVDIVNWVVPQLIRSGKLVKPSLGIKLVNQVMLRRAGYTEGVMIEQLDANSPAARAGLRPLIVDRNTREVTPGDLILSINGEDLRSNADYERLASAFQGGQLLKLKIRRDEKIIEVEITLPSS